MTLDEQLVVEVGRWIRAAQRCLVICHVRPDGDAIGSLLGLGLALREAGKDVQLVSEDGIPAAFRSLEGAATVRRSPEGDFNCVIVVDCSDLERTGAALRSAIPDINIDHHATNLLFARGNLVDVQAVATAELIAQLLSAWGLNISQPVAAALLTGIITDTIGFRTSNVTPQAMRLAADLMDLGAELPVLYNRALVQQSYEGTRLWGRGLSQLEREDRIVWTTLTLEDRQVSQYPGRDDADLINILSAIEETDIAIIFIEQPNRRVKVSWRAQPGFDVSQIALLFGGGGHTAAAGADISGSLPEVRSRVLELTRSLVNGGLRVQS